MLASARLGALALTVILSMGILSRSSMDTFQKDNFLWASVIVLAAALFFVQFREGSGVENLSHRFPYADLRIESAAVRLPDIRMVLHDTGESKARPKSSREILIEVIIQIESLGNPKMVGRAGERGLMQIMPSTWAYMTEKIFGEILPFDEAFDPALNIEVGSVYINELQDYLLDRQASWQSDFRSLILACYNYGPSSVSKAKFNVAAMPSSVRGYVRRGAALHNAYLVELGALGQTKLSGVVKEDATLSLAVR